MNRQPNYTMNKSNPHHRVSTRTSLLGTLVMNGGRTLFSFVLLVICATALLGCNTVKGVGRDVSATGHAVSGGAAGVQKAM